MLAMTAAIFGYTFKMCF